jgi:hypothetical protein
MKQMEINRTRKIKTIKIKGNINWEQKRKKYVAKLLLVVNKRSTGIVNIGKDFSLD